MTHEQIEAVIVEAVAPLMLKQKKHIEALEQRLIEAERKALSFGGTFNRAVEYKRNVLVTHDGGLWLAIKETVSQRPGTSEDWALVSKARGS